MKIVLFIFVFILAFVILVYGYFGGFRKIDLQIVTAGGEILVYEKVSGAYNQAAQISDKVYYELLHNHGIETTKGFGIFYDNPKNVEQSKLRSEVGCIVENIDAATLEKLKANFQVKTLPQENYLVAEFPFKGFPSIIIGMLKVHPALEKYTAENNLPDSPIMEIYDGFVNKKIIYRKFLK